MVARRSTCAGARFGRGAHLRRRLDEGWDRRQRRRQQLRDRERQVHAAGGNRPGKRQPRQRRDRVAEGHVEADPARGEWRDGGQLDRGPRRERVGRDQRPRAEQDRDQADGQGWGALQRRSFRGILGSRPHPQRRDSHRRARRRRRRERGRGLPQRGVCAVRQRRHPRQRRGVRRRRRRPGRGDSELRLPRALGHDGPRQQGRGPGRGQSFGRRHPDRQRRPVAAERLESRRQFGQVARWRARPVRVGRGSGAPQPRLRARRFRAHRRQHDRRQLCLRGKGRAGRRDQRRSLAPSSS